MSRRRKRIRLDRRTIVGLAGLAVLTIGAGWWRATSIVNRLLRGWAVGVVAQQSAGVYQLDPVGVHVNWFFRRVVVDSFRLTTDHGVNARQPQPLANVRIGLSHCTISGVHVLTLVRGAGLIAASMGCAAGSVAVEVPRRVWDSTAAPALPPTPRSARSGGLSRAPAWPAAAVVRAPGADHADHVSGPGLRFPPAARASRRDAARARTAPVAHGGFRDRSRRHQRGLASAVQPDASSWWRTTSSRTPTAPPRCASACCGRASPIRRSRREASGPSSGRHRAIATT